MSTRNIADIYPLSPLQQGMLFHSLYAPETGVYFEQSSWLLEGHLDEPALRKAWQKVIDRHPALRTSFLWEEIDEPLQVVHRQVELPVERQDWCDLDAVQQAARLDAFLKEDRQRGFDLTEAPLMRLALFQIAEDRFHFVWSHHHLLFDGWSQPIILKEFLTFYEAFRDGRQIVLPEPCSYRDYIAWLQRQNLSEAEAFWRRSLDGFQSRTLTGLDAGLALQEAGDEEGSYSHQTDLLPGRTLAALQTLAQQHRLTLNTFVQGAWALLLSRYSGEEDVVFGATVSGRPVDLPGAEGIVGMFINTLPVRVRVPREMAALDWLKEIQAGQVDLRQFEYSPLVDIQKWSGVPGDQPLFESLLVFENYPVNEAVRGQPASLALQPGPVFTRTNYPLTVAVSPGHDLGLEMAYDARRFSPDAIARLLGHFKTVLEALAANPDRPVSQSRS